MPRNGVEGDSDFGKGPAMMAYALIALSFIALIRTGSAVSMDFEVYYRAAAEWLQGGNPYDVAKFGFMVIKQPPWFIPLFTPFALFSLPVAKIIWAILQIGFLIAVLKKLQREFGLRPWVLAGTYFAFYGLWNVQFFLGHISILLLWSGFYLISDFKTGVPRRRSALAAFIDTAKVFTLFPFLGFGIRLFNLRFILKVLVLIALTASPLFIFGPAHSPLHWLSHWREAMFSSGAMLPVGQLGTLGRENQGFGALFARILHVPETDPGGLAELSVMAAMCLAVLWSIGSKNLPARDRWLGWLALTPCVQPLAWFHLFILAFPVCVVVMDRSFMRLRSVHKAGEFAFHRAQWQTLIACISVLLITAVTEKTLGAFGLGLELWSIKSFGVLCVLGNLLWLSSAQAQSG